MPINQLIYKPETVEQYLAREAKKEDEFQKLLHACYENQRRMRKAQLFAWWFTAVGLSVAVFCYLVKWNHWFGL